MFRRPSISCRSSRWSPCKVVVHCHNLTSAGLLDAGNASQTVLNATAASALVLIRFMIRRDGVVIGGVDDVADVNSGKHVAVLVFGRLKI